MTKYGIFDLEGRVALVTGGGSGLGRAYCEAMAEYGADVAMAGRTESKLKETAKIIGKYGHRSLVIKGDASVPADIQMMVDKTIKEFGRLDILFCNASDKLAPHLVHEMPVDEWDKTFNLNLRGVFLLIKAALPQMMKQKKGSIIITTSIGAFCASGVSMISAYASSKAGLIGLAKHVASEYGQYGIRTNCIAPGMHLTDIFANPDEQTKKVIQMHIDRTPLGRVGVPDDIKGLAIWLASDASSFVTGQTIVQDGGMTI
jgi:NAD(P)-dependent dehydrogenase (short-subunit alcohol dehydrogenase family)